MLLKGDTEELSPLKGETEQVSIEELQKGILDDGELNSKAKATASKIESLKRKLMSTLSNKQKVERSKKQKIEAAAAEAEAEAEAAAAAAAAAVVLAEPVAVPLLENAGIRRHSPS